MKKKIFIICISLAVLTGILLTSDKSFNIINKPDGNDDSVLVATDITGVTDTQEDHQKPGDTLSSMPGITPSTAQKVTPAPTPEITPQPVLEITSEDGTVVLYDIHKLSDNIASDRHIRIMPGIYELTAALPDEFDFKNIKNLTLEGAGEKPVRLCIENLRQEVMTFTDCSNITLINLELSPAREYVSGDYYDIPPEGNVLCFKGNNENITIKNCILCGYRTGLSATRINNFTCEVTVFTGRSVSAMEIEKLRKAAFIRCTFAGIDAHSIKIEDSRQVQFDDCLFGEDYSLFKSMASFGTVNRITRAGLINMAQEENGILVRNSLVGYHDVPEEYKNLFKKITASFPDKSFSVRILSRFSLDNLIVHLKTPFMLKGIDEIQQCFEKILFCLKDFSPGVEELFLETGPVDFRYRNIQDMLVRCRDGEDVSFWETDTIYFGPLDANDVNPYGNSCLTVEQAREILLGKIPLLVSTNNYEPFINASDIETGEPSLVFDEGRLFYLFDSFSYGIAEKTGYDCFCIDAVTGTLCKYFDEKYVEVSAADEMLTAGIVNYLDQTGALISTDDWMKVQVYDHGLVSVYIGGEQYYQLKIVKTPEGVNFEPYKPGMRFEGDCSPGVLEVLCRDYPVKKWNDVYDLQWTFSESMTYHFIYKIIGDVLLVRGDDGGLSGYHQEEYLYGLDIKTGKKLWSVFGGYLGFTYYFSKDQERIYVITRIYDLNDTNIKCIDMDTGKILWEEDIPGISSVCAADFVAILQRGEDGSLIRVLDEISGEVQWSKHIENGEVYLILYKEPPGLMIWNNDDIICFDWKTGEELWTVTSKQGVNHTMQDTPGDDGTGSSGQMTEWIPFDEEEKLIDLRTGQVLDVKPLESKKHITIIHLEDGKEITYRINEEYSIVRTYDEDIEWKKFFTVCSNATQEELWSKEDSVLEWVLYKDDLIYYTTTKITSVDLSTGVVNWCKPFSVDLDIGSLQEYHLINPVIVDDQLILSEQGKIVVFNLENGERLYEVDDYYIIHAYTNITDQYYKSLMVIDDMLFIGSGDGKLSCLKIKP